jgi:hypothetical protein
MPRRSFHLGLLIPFLLAGASQAYAQVARAGFLPLPMPATPVSPADGPFLYFSRADRFFEDIWTFRADIWRYRTGVALGLGYLETEDDRSGVSLDAAFLYEALRQRVSLTGPGVQLQAGVSAARYGAQWSIEVPASAGIFLNFPVPVPMIGGHVIAHPWLSGEGRWIHTDPLNEVGIGIGSGLRFLIDRGVVTDLGALFSVNWLRTQNDWHNSIELGLNYVWE